MDDILILVFNHSHCVVAINGTLQYNYHLLTSHTTVMYKNKINYDRVCVMIIYTFSWELEATLIGYREHITTTHTMLL